jgi:hypothetical protein
MGEISTDMIDLAKAGDGGWKMGIDNPHSSRVLPQN